jgi:hypothetical protein
MFAALDAKKALGVLITTNSFSATTTVQINNCFSSTYDNYVAYLTITASTANADVFYQLSLSATPAATGYLQMAAGGSFNSTALTKLSWTQTTGTGKVGTSIDIYSPAIAQRTTFTNDWFYDDNTLLGYQKFGGTHRTATAYDGLTITCATNITGTISIYGVKK